MATNYRVLEEHDSDTIQFPRGVLPRRTVQNQDEPLLNINFPTGSQTSSIHRSVVDDPLLSQQPHVVDDPLLSHQPLEVCPYPGAYPQPGGYPPPSYNYQTSHTNTIIVQQPVATQVKPLRDWSSSLCECGRDWSICCCGFWCCCCMRHWVSEDMGESTCLPCCVPGWLITLRTKMRIYENIQGSVMRDCCHVTCCGPCSLCQLAYEIKVVQENSTNGWLAMNSV